MSPMSSSNASPEPEAGEGAGTGAANASLTASSTQIRKAQNRIAQREFRLRKQQYIRDLEARVEILSGDKEERVELMLLLVRNLLKENKDLRSMVKSMAVFIGEGVGSCLPRLGLSPAQLDAILNRSDTDTAYEAFISLKASKEMEEQNPGMDLPGYNKVSENHGNHDSINNPGSSAGAGSQIGAGKRKRTVESPLSTMADVEGKRVRGVSPPPEMEMNGPDFGNWDFLFPDTNLTAVAGPGPSSQYHLHHQHPNSASTPTTGPPMSSGQGGTPINTGMNNMGDVQTTPEAERQAHLRQAVAHIMNRPAQGPRSPLIITAANNMTVRQVDERAKLQEELRQSMQGLAGEEALERKTEALQLITYHMNNFRINHEYTLPPSLRPTPVQRTLPHEHAIDGILFPNIRDRMILLRGKYDLVDAFHSYITEFTLHGDDALDHRNWEASERYLTDFAVLVDDEVYAVTNKWRATRGVPPLIRGPDTGYPISNGLGTGAGLAAEFLQLQAKQG